MYPSKETKEGMVELDVLPFVEEIGWDGKADYQPYVVFDDSQGYHYGCLFFSEDWVMCG